MSNNTIYGGSDFGVLGALAAPRAGTGVAGDIWQDLASLYTPTNLGDAFRLCEFLYLNFPTYRKGSERVVDYFLTDLKLSNGDDKERRKFEEVMRDDVKAMSALREVGINFMCFHRDTKVVTRNGTVPIASLTGQTVDVLSKDGVYRPAEFKSYGRQKLLKVTLKDGQEILATPEHNWEVKNSTGHHVEVTTEDLVPNSHRIPRCVAPRPEKNEEYMEGVRHGFIYGDGGSYGGATDGVPDPRKFSHAVFFGPKNAALLPYFEGHGNEKVPHKAPQTEMECWRQSGFPGRYRALPEVDRSASYWYGFLSGFLAADGSVDTYGCALLTQKDPEVLEAIAQQLPRIGMVPSMVRGQRRKTSFPNNSGPSRFRSYDSWIHMVTLLKQFMQPDDFIIPDHREKFEKNWNPGSKYGQYVGIKSVEETGMVDEVFCCEEMETHRFVIGRGVLVANCYGNAIVSPHFPFLRNLKCRTCHSSINIKKIGGSFTMDWKTGDFHAFCHKCNQTKAHRVVDYSRMAPKDIRLVSWDPKRVQIETNMITGDSQYWYDIPDYVKREVRGGNPFFLATMPKPFLDCIRGGKKFLFNPESIFHIKESKLAGLDLRGWGVPSVLTGFRNFFRLQMLHRQDEKLMLDYITPMRMLSPKTAGYTEGNTIVNSSMKNWMGNIEEMIQRHRMDGANWNLIPFPVEYQAIGGEGRQLSPKDLIEHEEDRLLNARGVPPEFYRASLTLQAAPVALRLFERCWSSLVNGQNDLLQWWSKSIAHYLRSGEYNVELSSVTIVDDIDSKVWRLQAMASELLSKETALTPMGIDSREEYEKLLEQQKFEARKTEEAQREMEMASISLDSSEGGEEEGSAAGAQGGTTPEGLNAQADQMARELLTLPEGDRHRQLSSIRQTNDTLHALVLKKMDQLRSQARSMGQDMAMQQVVQQPPQQ